MFKNKKFWLVVILLVATAVRFYKIAAISLWHDEAFSALLINYPWREMIYRIGLDVHPPVYYIVLRLWADIFGHSLLALRGFSLFFGVATVYATYLFVKAAFENETVALGAAALIAISPFQIQYVTEARMYTFGTFVLMLSAYLLTQALKKDSWKYWIWFAITTSLSIYTHYYLFFSAAALGIFALIYIHREETPGFAKYKKFFGAYILVFLSFLPWLKTFMFQFSQVQSNYWIPKIDKWSVPLTNWRMLIGAGADAAKTRTEVFLILGCLFSLYMIYRVMRQKELGFRWLAIYGLVIPFAGAILLSIKQSIYLDRYFLFAALFYSIVLMLFIYQLSNKFLKVLLFVLIIGISAVNWADYWVELHVDQRPGLAAAAAYLNNNVAKNDGLVVGSSFEFFNFKYYNNTGHPPLLYTPGIKKVTDLPHYSGTALLDDSDLIHDLNVGSTPGKTEWVLWTNGFGGTEPGVPSNWIKVDQKSWDDVRPYVGTTIFVDQFEVTVQK